MANADHLALLLKEGVDAWNAWRVKQASSVPDLSGADLHGVNLHEANFYEANLSGVPRDNQDESSDDQDESDTGSGRREGVARP